MASADRLPLSATLIVKDEEGVVEAALDQLADLASEIVIVDSFSTDSTSEICRRYTDRVVTRDLTSFSDQKNHAASLACHDWILNLDADERLDRDLVEWIRAAFREGSPRNAAAYCFPRMTFDAAGRWILKPYSYPGFHHRLYDRTRARWVRPVHETLEVSGKRRFVAHHILHYPDRGKKARKERLYSFLDRTGAGRAETSPGGVLRWARTLFFYTKAMFIDLGFLRKGPRFWIFGLEWLWISFARAAGRSAARRRGGS